MKRTLILAIALLGWAALVIQFDLIMQNRVASKADTLIRFFSFFTILTNLLVAAYFSGLAFKFRERLDPRSKWLTPLTINITIVGLVCQILLRHTWSPTGLQMVLDELLHSVIPALVILYWFLYSPKSKPHYRQIAWWILYPLAYLIYILIRGSHANFYPYPFVNVSTLGLQKVLLNAGSLLNVFVLISAVFIRIRKA